MAKKSKLILALEARKGRNYKLEKQRKQEKAAAKRKKARGAEKATEEAPEPELEEMSEGWESDEDGPESIVGEVLSSVQKAKIMAKNGPTSSDDIDIPNGRLDGDGVEQRSEHDEQAEGGVETVDGADQQRQEEGEDSEAEESDIPLSEIASLASEDRADIVPHQRLTINNTTALLAAYKSIALPYKTLPFSAYQTLATPTPELPQDINDDLSRELAFYKQALDATTEGRALLLKEGVPFSRPNDYFAEMVKTDEHMSKIKQRMREQAASRKASQDARKMRDAKKFGKQVQVAKEQERAKAKRDTLEKINLLKRKRKSADTGNPNEEDLFDVALEDAAKDRKGDGGREKRGTTKRQKKDAKFGFGGKKRFAKSGDAVSSGDMGTFSVKRMKGKPGGKTPRPGKSRRAKARI